MKFSFLSHIPPWSQPKEGGRIHNIQRAVFKLLILESHGSLISPEKLPKSELSVFWPPFVYIRGKSKNETVILVSWHNSGLQRMMSYSIICICLKDGARQVWLIRMNKNPFTQLNMEETIEVEVSICLYGYQNSTIYISWNSIKWLQLCYF